MIIHINEEIHKAYTDGLAEELIDYNIDREKVINELKENIIVTESVCKVLGLPFEKFINETVAEGNSGH